MRNLCNFGAGLLLALLSLSACNDNNVKYPDEYVGFSKRSDDYVFDKTTKEEDISIKIIAAKKSNVDREVAISCSWKPGTQPSLRLLDTKVIIPAKKKSATARIRVFPNKMKQNEEIRVICSPRDTEVKQTQLLITLVAK
ncbi:hypothetical protein [Bacteroides sp.]|uniref:hypothetical protein n=1 Tax=Bacteroides sp. TaxID=29523 RepID=UPI003AB36168